MLTLAPGKQNVSAHLLLMFLTIAWMGGSVPVEKTAPVVTKWIVQAEQSSGQKLAVAPV